MDNEGLAGEIRKKIAMKKRAGHGLGNVYLSNNITLATSVWVDINKTVAKCFITDKDIIFVSAFSLSPLPYVIPKEGRKGQWLTILLMP